MPAALTFPGVYIEEIPSGVRTITGVATSIGAFVDFFQRGPLNSAVQLFSVADFERELGGLDIRSAASYGIPQFFVNGGTEAFAVRVGGTGIATAAFTLMNAANLIVKLFAGRSVLGASVVDPGAWGNGIWVDVDYATTDPTELWNLTLRETAIQDGRRVVRRTETFRNLTMRPDVAGNAQAVVNDGSKLVQLTRDGLATAFPDPFDPSFRPAETATLTGTWSAVLPAVPAIPASGSQLKITLSAGPVTKDVTLTYASTPADYAGLRPLLEAAIQAADPGNPLLAGATVQLTSDNKFRVLLGTGGPAFDPATTATFAEKGAGTTAATLKLIGAGSLVGPQQITLAGGVDGALPAGNDLKGSRAAKTGLFALEDVSLFNILCLPRAADLADSDMRAVYAAAEAYCEERRAFLIVDIPDGTKDLAGMQTWLGANDSLRHRNAAVYFPRVMVADPLNQNRPRSFAASGTMAGLYAATDAARGVWKAPAGTDAVLRNVQDLADVLTDGENGALNPVAVNCLRNFPVFGNVAWGARTLDGADQKASEWKYIPVRRLALYLEESLFRGTKWVVFEPNDEPLWAQIRLNLGAFMQSLFRQGAFQGQTPRDAYFVKCDKETTTQNDIDLGIVNIVVGFAPLKPAEFVVIKIQQLAGQIPT
jgi:uncharacterized protein